jgi:predicted glycosyltransferase
MVHLNTARLSAQFHARQPAPDRLSNSDHGASAGMHQGDGRGSSLYQPRVSSRAAPPKVFLYSHDTFGLGHLRRNLAIAKNLLARGCSVHLLTGSPVIGSWSLPRGLQVQPLPPVVKTGAETYAARDPQALFEMTKGYREALILKSVLRHQPDIFLVDHAPAGMNGELLSTLALIRRELPGTRAILGLRDILDSPDIVRKLWRDQGIYRLIEHAYDDVLVYGSEALFDVVDGYEMPASVAAKLHYCGHVVGASEQAAAAGSLRPAICWNQERAGARPVVLVTAGGGGDGYFLMEAYLRALALLPPDLIHSVIVTGPLMPEAQSAALNRLAAGRADIEMVHSTTDLTPSIKAASLVVAMAGYNTSAEIIAYRKRAILVPRAAPRAEQRMRAALLAKLGLVLSVEPGAGLAENLALLIRDALSEPAPSAQAWAALDLDGASRVGDFLEECAAKATRSQGKIL